MEYMNIEQTLKIMQRAQHNEVMEEILARNLDIIQYNEMIQRERHEELMPAIIRYNQMLKRHQKKRNNWIHFIQYYSSIMGTSLKESMKDPECKRIYRLQYQ